MKGVRQAICLLGAVLVLQSRALALGVDVGASAARTQQVMQAQLEGAFEAACPTSPPEPEPALPAAETDDSDWDPEPVDTLMSASSCRALLLEVVRRAAHDYTLYKNTRRFERVFAQDAYVWLFEEDEEHPNWELRKREGTQMLSFLSICEALDLDPETVRARVRKMTVKDIMTSGRPAESRKAREGIEDYTSPAGVDLASIEQMAYEGDSYAVQSSYY